MGRAIHMTYAWRTERLRRGKSGQRSQCAEVRWCSVGGKRAAPLKGSQLKTSGRSSVPRSHWADAKKPF